MGVVTNLMGSREDGSSEVSSVYVNIVQPLGMGGRHRIGALVDFKELISESLDTTSSRDVVGKGESVVHEHVDGEMDFWMEKQVDKEADSSREPITNVPSSSGKSNKKTEGKY